MTLRTSQGRHSQCTTSMTWMFVFRHDQCRLRRAGLLNVRYRIALCSGHSCSQSRAWPGVTVGCPESEISCVSLWRREHRASAGLFVHGCPLLYADEVVTVLGLTHESPILNEASRTATAVTDVAKPQAPLLRQPLSEPLTLRWP